MKAGRLLFGLLLIVSFAVDGRAAGVCGSTPDDAGAVAAAESSAVTACDCCTPPRERRRCLRGLVKSALQNRSLPKRCAGKVIRDTKRVCPLQASDIACHVCRTNADCSGGQFCECAPGTCGTSGGVCRTIPQVCPQVYTPVCGCDGLTYPDDCARQHAGVCKRHDGPCVEPGGCFDPVAGACTGTRCGPDSACGAFPAFCSPDCAPTPGSGTCLDLLRRKCTVRACSVAAPCLPNERCVEICPLPSSGRCFITVDLACSDEPCDPQHPCGNPNEVCSPLCTGSPTTTLPRTTTTTRPPVCASDAECTDNNPCTFDRCVGGTCEHACVCVGVGSTTCCPGPADLCVRPCGSDPSAGALCGGFCPSGASCLDGVAVGGCSCVSDVGGPCGGNILAPPVHCGPGLVCQQPNPDVTGTCIAAP